MSKKDQPCNGGHLGFEEYGMTLRDYFAAKALQGFCADGSMAKECRRRGLGVDESRKVYAKNAYAMADAMLAERDKR